jgi:hypothetical protein
MRYEEQNHSQKFAIHLFDLVERPRRDVFNELCDIVEEAIASYREEGRLLPPPTDATAHR